MLNFLRPPLYIQMPPDPVTVKNVRSGASVADVPDVAISVGAKPTELSLKTLVRQVHGQSILAIAPAVSIHPLGSPAGGFTQVEIRAFREMGHSVGARTTCGPGAVQSCGRFPRPARS